MHTPGLVSVTFRGLPPERVASLAAGAGLGSVEWGGDVHVPHGDLARARDVRRVTADAGLVVSAYGSYYRAGVGTTPGLAFDRVLATARELGAPAVRVWAGAVGSARADGPARAAATADLARICPAAADAGVGVSLEFHADTLADTAGSTLALIRDVAHPNLTCYWQPPNGMPARHALRGLQLLLPHVRDLHVFHWWPDHLHRRPLYDGADRWRAYLRLLASSASPRHASLEFVAGDSPEALREDATTLRQLLLPCA